MRPASSNRTSTAARWAVNPSAVARAATVPRSEARPSRLSVWICRHDPKSSVDNGPIDAARPPVGSTWLAPLA